MISMAAKVLPKAHSPVLKIAPLGATIKLVGRLKPAFEPQGTGKGPSLRQQAGLSIPGIECHKIAIFAT